MRQPLLLPFVAIVLEQNYLLQSEKEALNNISAAKELKSLETEINFQKLPNKAKILKPTLFSLGMSQQWVSKYDPEEHLERPDSDTACHFLNSEEEAIFQASMGNVKGVNSASSSLKKCVDCGAVDPRRLFKVGCASQI